MDVTPIRNSSGTAAQPKDAPVADDGDDELGKRVNSTIVGFTQSPPAVPWWESFGPATNLRRFSIGAAQLLSALRTKFTDDELTRAGAAVQTSSGELRLSPTFATDLSLLIRRDEHGQVVDIISAQGSLRDPSPLYRRYAAEAANGTSPVNKPIVLCEKEDELCALARIGIACIPVPNLARLTGKDIRTLFAHRPNEKQGRKFQLTIPGWQISSLKLDPTPARVTSIEHIAGIRATYNLDPGDVFRVWLPEQRKLRAMMGAHRLTDVAALRKAIKASMKESLFTPREALRLLTERRPLSWSDALAQLERLLQKSTVVPRTGEVEIALKKLENAFNAQVIGPIKAQLGAGLDALLGLGTADLAQTWFEELEAVVAARRVIDGQHPNRRQRLDDSALKRKLQIAGAIASLARVKYLR
jgi:hypothetical protein